jgi:hypothetical protein
VIVPRLSNRRELENGRALTGSQISHHHDLAIGEFQCVVMDIRPIHVDLAEPRHSPVRLSADEQVDQSESESAEYGRYFVVKGQLGA